MDKKQLAVEIFKKVAVQECRTIDQIMDSIDRLEQTFIARGWVKIESCPKCLHPITYIDLEGSYRAQCDCTKAQGENKEGAYNEWVQKILNKEVD